MYFSSLRFLLTRNLSMEQTLYQGYLDSLCGIYSILNADKIVNGTPEFGSQELFNDIIDYLDRRKILKETLLGGCDHKTLSKIIRTLENINFPLCKTNKRGIIKLNDWWKYSKEFLEGGQNRTIILSIGGRIYHLTVIERMTDRTIYLRDSSVGWRTIKKSMCRMAGYPETDKYIIYPSQCWYLGKE